MLTKEILKSLDKTRVKEFLQEKKIDFISTAKKYDLDITNKNFEFHLLNKLIYNSKLTPDDIDKFLINELNYGKMKNVFVRFIDSTLITDVKNAINRINSLEKYGYIDASKVSSSEFKKNLRKHVDVGCKKLIYSKIHCGQSAKVDSITLLLAEGIQTGEDTKDPTNNYYSIEINLKYNYFVLRIRNWSSEASNDYNPDKIYSEIEKIMSSCFGIIFNRDSQKYINSMYSIVCELTSKALDTVSKEVNNKIKQNVYSSVINWAKTTGIMLNIADEKLLTESILNNFYKYYMKKTYGKITHKKMVDIFGLYAYPRKVKFLDDTVGEGKALSPDPSQSLLDTAVFYDLKARLDHSKQLLCTTIYWLQCPNNDCFGTTIYTDAQNLFKIVFLPLKFNKEMCNYVLQQIKRNFES